MAKTRSITPLDIHIGNRLKQARSGAAGKLSGETVGAAINVQAQQYSRYETAQNRLSAANLYRLACYFEKPISWFFMEFDHDDDPILASINEPKGGYRVATEPEEIEAISNTWKNLSQQQRTAILRLLESMTGPQNKQ